MNRTILALALILIPSAFACGAPPDESTGAPEASSASPLPRVGLDGPRLELERKCPYVSCGCEPGPEHCLPEPK